MYTKYISTFLFVLACALQAGGQNIPQLTETEPAGTVITIPVPQAPTTTTGQNYIKTSSPMFPVVDPAQLNVQGPQNLKESYSYMDGFSRVYQTLQSNVSSTATGYQHQVQIADTRFQKEQLNFLPYTSSTLSLQSNAFEAQKNYYNSLYPGEGYTSYSKTISNGNRGSISYAPGKSQVGGDRGTVTNRITNLAGQVRTWDLDANGKPVSTGTYNANELFGEETIAPIAQGSGNVSAPSSRVFTDKDGRVVLKMVADSFYASGGGVPQITKTYLSTYYVYNEMGQLCYTLPPKAVQLIEQNSWAVTQTVLDNLCFQYGYDNKGRMKEQRFPGEKGFTTMVYDHKQRVVMLQSPNDRAKQQYQLTYYDKLNRVIATSLYSNASLAPEWQASFDLPPSIYFPANDIRHYMGFNLEGVIPNDDGIPGQQLLTYNFYDSYEVTDPGNTHFTNYNNQLQFSADLQTTGIAEVPIRSFRTRGQLTGSKIKIMPSANASAGATGTWSWLHNYYDEKGRLINMLKVDYNDTIVHYTYAGTQYDFLNRALISKSIFRNVTGGTSVYTERNKNVYQQGTGALLSTHHKINNGPWNVIANYEYDAFGRVKRKGLGNYGESQNFSYNMRGQLTGINALYAETGNKGGASMTFGESLKYDYGFSVSQYNGKIAGTVWRGGSGTVHAYGYDYDLSGRLKNAEYRTSGATFWNKTSLDYTVSNVNYDKNGNLLSMDQRGVSPTSGVVTIDNLRYNYEDNEQSNRLLKVQDAMTDYGLGDFVNTNGTGNDYDYDDNGNLKLDQNKGISSVSYTYFDKPQVITFTNGNRIEYSYDATGAKVQELVKKSGQADKVTDYVGAYIYESNKLRCILTAEGRSVRDTVNDSFKEEYFVKDHLGNVRSTIDVEQKPLLQYLATYELASANLEGLLFEQLNEIRDDKPASTDPADLKAGRLNGEDQRIGTSLLMHVMAGDQVSMNVNTFYDSYDQETDNPVTGEQMLASIVGTLTGGVGGFQGSEGHNPDMVQQLFTPENYLDQYSNLVQEVTDLSRPRAYLNYVLFDENMQIDKTFSSAFQANSEGSWQQIGTTAPLTIPTNGYLAVYLSNRSRSIGCYNCADVNFDQLVIEIQKGKQLEESHYYPFGLPMAGLSTAAENNTIAQRRKYQSNEYIKDLGLNWMDFHARQYDPQLGRFLGVDPKATSGGQDRYSTYAAMGNEPESVIDPNGEQMQFSNAHDPSLNFFTSAGNYQEGAFDNGTGVGVNSSGGINEGGVWNGGDIYSSGASAVGEQYSGQAAREKFLELTGQSKPKQGEGSTASNLADYNPLKGPKGEELTTHESGKFNYSLTESKDANSVGIKFDLISTVKNSGYDDLDYIQSVASNLPDPSKLDAKPNEFYLDGTSRSSKPFYYSPGDKFSADRTSYNNSYQSYFSDGPRRSNTSNHYWLGQLTLMGKKNGIWESIFTIRYGYHFTGGKIELIRPVISVPEKNQLLFLKMANYAK